MRFECLQSVADRVEALALADIWPLLPSLHRLLDVSID